MKNDQYVGQEGLLRKCPELCGLLSACDSWCGDEMSASPRLREKFSECLGRDYVLFSFLEPGLIIVFSLIHRDGLVPVVTQSGLLICRLSESDL